MGTTKLTRKEILAEDPVHQAIISLVEVLRVHGRNIGLAAAVVVLLSFGTYLGLQYLESRDMRAQQDLSRAMAFFHAQIDPSAADDPYGKGPDPSFRRETDKYQAASREFSTVVSKYGSSKLAVIARYYLGLSQLRLGQKTEAVRSLETVRNNTKDRTVGYLAKKVLAQHYMDSGNYKEALEILDGMIKDPQCDLPREDLRLDLARVYLAQGKRDDAMKVLRAARDESVRSALQGLVMQEASRLEEGAAASADISKPASNHP